MMPSDYALTQITTKTAQELHERAACSRQAREIAAEHYPGTPFLARLGRLLKRRPAMQPTGAANLRASPR
jgi:hypothetical protein